MGSFRGLGLDEDGFGSGWSWGLGLGGDGFGTRWIQVKNHYCHYYMPLALNMTNNTITGLPTPKYL